MNISLFILGHGFAYEMECVLRLFFPGERIAVLKEESDMPEDCVITRLSKNGKLVLYVSAGFYGNYMDEGAELPLSATESEQERVFAVLLFKQLKEITGIRPPWGVLTGVRPVRFCRNLLESGLDDEGVYHKLTQDYLVEPKKARLALETGKTEWRVLEQSFDRAFSLYISIPFCPSRCLYCSFVSSEIDACLKLTPDYVRLLCEEIRYTAKVVRSNELTLQTVYIGGGTPTTLSAGDLSAIMETVRECYDFSGLLEYTVEAGRPDTITPDKLKAIKNGGAARVSINPQTMDDNVLRGIGRKHTPVEVIESFYMAREAGFGCVNMDIIAGLPGDTDDGFMDTVKKVIALAPENITVHTLTVKRSSNLRKRDDAYKGADMNIGACLDLAGEQLCMAGYIPYYMYRQKGTRGNHENTGYAKPGYEGVYNVYTMEEAHTILAVGAGGVSKICLPCGDIKRVYNFKYPHEYCSRFYEMLRRKDDTNLCLKLIASNCE